MTVESKLPSIPPRTNWLMLASTFALAAVVRAVPWQLVMTKDGVIFSDSDGYSHMWRIWNLASRSIPLSVRDPFVNFPHGGEVLWSPGLDWTLAMMIRGLGLDQRGAEIFCAWFPLVVGALSVCLAAWIAARTFGATAGWVTGVMLAVLPGSFLYTRLGYLDHHVAITMIGTAMLGGAMHIVSIEAGEGDATQPGAGPRFWPIFAGLLCAVALLVWAGALLHIGVLQIAMLVWALGASSEALAQQRTLRLASAHALVALLILPFSLREWEVFGNFSPLALTRFQPVWYGAGALCLVVAALLWRSPTIGRTRHRRLAAVAAVGVVGLVLAFATIPQLAAVLDRSAGWFTKDMAFVANISELRPLFSPGKDPIWWRPVHYFSPLLFVFPAAWLAVAWRSVRPERWVLLFWTAAFCLLVLAQSRFVNTFSVAYGIVWGGAATLLIEALVRRFATPSENSARSAQRGASAFVAIALGMALALPTWSYYSPRILKGGEAVYNYERQARIVIARLLANSIPPPLDANGEPTASLLCMWASGHEVRYYSGWPVNQDGFGPYVSPENTTLATRYFETSDEDEAIAILERMGTRLVIADIMGSGQPPYSIETMTRRLVDFGGSGVEVDPQKTGSRSWMPALTRHRLVFAYPNGNGGAWLYEIVPGAIVTGSTTPDSDVIVEIQLGSPSGRPRIWRTRQHVDETGVFRLRVPYATSGAPPTPFSPLGPYRLHTPDGVARFDVNEAAIQAQGVVRVP